MTDAHAHVPAIAPQDAPRDHLNREAREALDTLSDEERIEWIRRTRWIGYTRARSVLDRLEDLLTYPKKHRMPNLLIVGDTNNGKTTITSKFQRDHPAHDDPEGDGIILPVLVVQSPAGPDEGRFYDEVLKNLFAPFRMSDKPGKKQFQAIHILKRTRTRMLVIDEIHNIIAGNLGKQRYFLNMLKYLGNELQIPLVGVGTREAFNALQTDPQLSNRFEPVVLPKWEMNEEYLRLLASFERMIPLAQASGLARQRETALKLLSMSEGVIGELSTILVLAATRAVSSGGERITPKLLDSLGWTRPSERKRKAS